MPKPNISTEQIQSFCKTNNIVAEEILPIPGGEFSQAFEIVISNSSLILRLNNISLGFEKECIINKYYSHIKAPKVTKTGKFNDLLYYAVSEKLAGQSLKSLHTTEIVQILPDLFENTNSIHTTKIDTDGYGNWYANQIGQFVSWKERLDCYIERDSWDEIIRNSRFTDFTIFKELEKEYIYLLAFVPDQRYFLHGDLGRTNIFAKDSAITGIIDWSEAMYGDFLWDIAWLDFWVPEIHIANAYIEYNMSNKRLNFTNYKERLRLYKIVAGIHNALFAAKQVDEEGYKLAIEIMLQ